MWSHMPSRERFGYAAIAALTLLGMGLIGSRHLRKPAPIVLGTTPSAPGVPPPGAPLSPSSEAAQEIVVHVAGAVRRPGLLRLRTGARVDDAIRQAGGALPTADLDSLNLAARLTDGERVVVRKASASASTYPPPALPSGAETETAPPSTSPSGEPEPAPGSISLNNATAAELEAIPGVGPATARSIVEYRERHGSFQTVDELMAVPGIGTKKMEKMRPYLAL